MNQKGHALQRWELFLSVALILIAVVSFYLILFAEAVNLPVLDDYHAVLAFLATWSGLHGPQAKAWYIVTAQHNEYKLVFEHVIFVVELSLLKHINFLSFIAIGNAFIVFIGILLYAFLRPEAPSAAARFTLYVPIAFLLFQLQYAETLDWSMISLVGPPVIFFSLLALWLLQVEGTRNFALACLCLVLAISSSANGFVLVPIGALILGQQKHYSRWITWFAVTAVIAGFYFYHYNSRVSSTHSHQSLIGSLTHLNLVYALVFLGAAAPKSLSHSLCFVFGLALCILFANAFKRKYYRRNPATFYGMALVLLTGLGVSGIRADLGVELAASSRYVVYSTLLLALSYIYLLDYFGSHVREERPRRILVAAAIVLSMAFCAWSDIGGYHFLRGRKGALIAKMAMWESGAAGSARDEPAITSDTPISGDDVYKPFGVILRRSMELKNYVPPRYPSTP